MSDSQSSGKRSSITDPAGRSLGSVLQDLHLVQAALTDGFWIPDRQASIDALLRMHSDLISARQHIEFLKWEKSRQETLASNHQRAITNTRNEWNRMKNE